MTDEEIQAKAKETQEICSVLSSGCQDPRHMVVYVALHENRTFVAVTTKDYPTNTFKETAALIEQVCRNLAELAIADLTPTEGKEPEHGETDASPILTPSVGEVADYSR